MSGLIIMPYASVPTLVSSIHDAFINAFHPDRYVGERNDWCPYLSALDGHTDAQRDNQHAPEDDYHLD